MSPRRALIPGHRPSGFDEIRIKTSIRWKESELSGDEFRTSMTIEFLRKGRVVHQSGAGTMDSALLMIGAAYVNALDAGKGYFAGEGHFCDQFGCCNKATKGFWLMVEYDRMGRKQEIHPDTPQYRMFCDRHSHRGNCALEDSDDNMRPMTPTEFKDLMAQTPNLPKLIDI